MLSLCYNVPGVEFSTLLCCVTINRLKKQKVRAMALTVYRV